jgi:hypothetical protein
LLEWIVEGITIHRGELLDITFLGVGLAVPPFDIKIWAGTKLLADTVWKLFFGWLDKSIEEYYKEKEPHQDVG